MSNNTAAVLVSPKQTEVAQSHGLRVLDEGEVAALMQTPAGEMVAEMMVTALFHLQDAVRDAQTASLKVINTAETIKEQLSEGLRCDDTWVAQAANRLGDALTRRQAAVDSYIQAHAVAVRIISGNLV